MNFTHFIGIDWSGARNPGRGLEVAQCPLGTAVPQIVPNRDAGNWRRAKVLDWLIQLNKKGKKVLVGFDFAFAYPYCDKEAYFHGHDGTPEDAESLWELIDDICQDARDFYGGPFYLNQDAPFSDYLLYQTYRGNRYSPRKRKTENLCTEMGGNPASVFKCVGPESVGIGSLAGMRLLHRVNSHLNRDFIIWPFQDLDNRRSVFVEIFPRLFYKLAGQNPREWRNRDTVNNALKWFGSDELPPDLTIESEDQIDAIISAAALRHLSKDPRTWQSEKLTKCARDFEGWIFGAV